MFKHFILSTLAIIMACFCGACTDAELCYDIEHPHRANVKFTFNWEKYETNASQIPDSMFIIADRVFNSWKCGLKVDPETGQGRYLINGPNTNISNEESAETEEGTEIGDVAEDTEASNQTSDFKLRTGTFKLITFNMDDTELDYSNVYTYMADEKNQIKLQDLYVTYRSYSKKDPNLRKPTNYWVDYNQYSEYIQTEMPAVHFDTLESLEILARQNMECRFNPQPLTQDIEVIFRIHKKDGVPFVIDSVIAEMSGIPHKINLSNGYVDITKTYKMMFKLELEDEDGNPIIEDNTERDLLTCRKHINVTGLVSSNSSEMTIGPGIMQVLIFATATSNSNGTEITISKKIQGKINLCNTINKAELIELTEDGQHARRSKLRGVLEIADELKIDGKNIIETEGDNKIDRWTSCEGIIVDI